MNTPGKLGGSRCGFSCEMESWRQAVGGLIRWIPLAVDSSMYRDPHCLLCTCFSRSGLCICLRRLFCLEHQVHNPFLLFQIPHITNNITTDSIRAYCTRAYIVRSGSLSSYLRFGADLRKLELTLACRCLLLLLQVPTSLLNHIYTSSRDRLSVFF